MKLSRIAAVVCLLSSTVAAAADLVVPRKGTLSSVGDYVTVALDAYAANRTGLELPIVDKQVQIGGVPFDLVVRPDADNLFLKSAEWPDWKTDPSSYYSAYDKGPETSGDPRRPLFKIPVADYSAAYLLAAAETDPALSSTVSFRIGAFDGPRRTTLHDFSAGVPRSNESKRGATVVQVIPQKAGNVFVVRVPLGSAFAQDFRDEWAFDVELTKELRLAVRRPDPCRYQIRPLGLPSGVHVYGMTFQRAPVQMEVTSDEAGHVFNEPDRPTFRVALRQASRKLNVVVEAAATDVYGNVTTVRSDEIALAVGGGAVRDLTIPVPKRGFHRLTVRVVGGRSELLRRETTFALLPKDDRRRRDSSPFGTWDFSGGHFTPNDPDVVGPLYVKAGLRYGMFGFTPEDRAKYGVLPGSEPRSADDLAKRLENDPRALTNVLIFHEHAISGPHIMRTPDVFTGRSPYRLDEQEQARFDTLWNEALETARSVRSRFPKAHLALGNGNPHLLEEFLRHKFPSELFDSRGNECGSFMRMPETQPTDFVANNAGLWMDRKILDHYGYGEKPITQCYEVGYPCTNPGNLTLDEQADYFVRHMIHSLVWKIPVIRMGSITDMGNSYYHSNWGASGLCFAKPDVRPKPSYVAVATLTRQLDGATFRRIVPTGSTAVYAVEFADPDGGYVTAFWTLRGTRDVHLAGAADGVAAVDGMSNSVEIRSTEVGAAVTVGSSPAYVSSSKPLEIVRLDAPTYEGRPTKQDRPFVVSTLAKLDDWRVETDRSSELEFYNFENPRRSGVFDYEEVAESDGEKRALRITPQLPGEGSPYLPMYSVLAHRAGVEIPGEPTEIGLLVRGNGGWGRVIFELQDADGERWISIGAAARGEPTRWMADWMPAADLERMKAMSIGDWNTNDSRQRSRFNFDGWRYVRFPLPGQYPGEGYHWPSGSQWKSDGDGRVQYPLTFKKLVFELPAKVLYLNDYRDPIRRDISVKDLTATYAPVE